MKVRNFTKRKLSAAEIEARLRESLDPVLSTRRSARGPARALAAFEREQQELVMHWVEVISKTNAELGFLFAVHAPEGLRRMTLKGMEAWTIRAMDVYDNAGLHPASRIFTDAEGFAAGLKDKAVGRTFDEAAGILELFIHGLSGRRLKIQCLDTLPAHPGVEPSPSPWTDSEVIFLPAMIARFADRDSNFLLFKATAAYLWAQCWYGTFKADLSAACTAYDDPRQALQLLHALETLRIEARISTDLPGLHRDFMALRARLGDPPYPGSWKAAIEALRWPHASVHTSIGLMPMLYGTELPSAPCYQGALFPDRVAQVMAARQAREKAQLRAALAGMSDLDDATALTKRTLNERFRICRHFDTDHSGRPSYEFQMDGKAVAPPPDVKALIDSILQDFGEIPQEYLTAADDAGFGENDRVKHAENALITADQESGAILYHEWDHRRQHYRKHWCVMREVDVPAADLPFVAQTRQKYAPLIAQLRRTFEALRGQEQLLKKQLHGDDVDFDALVEAFADMSAGRELSDRLFTKLHKLDRDIAVMFMIDMSGSTKGWINDAEREALVMLCEALEILGDRYAIYGFSGITRKRCELYRIKRIEEPYNDEVRGRIAGITPQDYTRMGVTIRHLTRLLNEIEARTKLLITLSDGKPDDYDGYRGDYGIEDTRQALVEARRSGIHPFCITIDETARDYLPHMYGAVNWTLVSDVRKLPVKVADIYQRLTA